MICVFGSINMDLIATTPRLPGPGETVTGTGFSTAAGGKGANQALAARRAGAEVRMVGAVGRDAFAAPSLRLLQEAGVDLSGVAKADGATGTALILVGGDGENMIAVVAGANGSLDASHAQAAVDRMQAQDYLMVQLELPAAAVEAALNHARQRGVRSVLNTAPMTEEAATLARLCDIVIANETEFDLLVGTGPMNAGERREKLMALHAERGQTLVVTLGADGVIAAEGGTLHEVRGLVITPVDTVGAGDTFCGYLTAGLHGGLDFPSALRRAAVAGSLACLAPGAQPAIPHGEAVDRAL